ncbi:hypothetical protein D929_00007, partial [Enterococcus faecalis 02-MB-P-10]|uniref:lectin-like domain-containing protein n=1 Tax=Enterococcus faecalis TaxID=1351 RepID=UPI000353DEFF
MNKFKKYVTTLLTAAMVIGPNIGGVAAFAEAITDETNQELYFEKDNQVIDKLSLTEGEEVSVDLVDKNTEDKEADIILPENTEYVEEAEQQNISVSTDEQTQLKKIHVTFEENKEKRVSVKLKGTMKTEAPKELYAKTMRSNREVKSKPVMVEVKAPEAAPASDSQVEVSSEQSSNSEESSSDDADADGSSSLASQESVEQSSSSDKEAASSTEAPVKRASVQKAVVAPAAAPGNLPTNVPAPPASNTNILDYFNVPSLGSANNSARPNTDYPQSVTINPNTTGQFGVMWANTTIDLKNDFDMSTYVYLYNPTNPQKHGDGMNFVLQNDKAGNTAYGRNGWGIGTYGSPSDGDPAIQNALSFEMDTYYNGVGSEIGISQLGDGRTQNLQNEQEHTVDYYGHIAVLETNSDITKDHADKHGVGTGEGGDFGIMTHHNVQEGTASNSVWGNRWKNFTVKWDAKSQTMTYSFEGFQPISYHVADLNKTFGGTTVRFGFTGSTGSSTEYNLVSFDKLPVAPVTVRYKDIDTGKELENATKLSGALGAAWNSEKKAFDQYEYVKVEGPVNGTFTQMPQEVTYFYKKLLPKLELAKTVDKANANVGDELTYTITAKNTGDGD